MISNEKERKKEKKDEPDDTEGGAEVGEVGEGSDKRVTWHFWGKFPQLTLRHVETLQVGFLSRPLCPLPPITLLQHDAAPSLSHDAQGWVFSLSSLGCTLFPACFWSVPPLSRSFLFSFLFFFSSFFFLVPADCSHSLYRYTGPSSCWQMQEGGCFPFFMNPRPTCHSALKRKAACHSDSSSFLSSCPLSFADRFFLFHSHPCSRLLHVSTLHHASPFISCRLRHIPPSSRITCHVPPSATHCPSSRAAFAASPLLRRPFVTRAPHHVSLIACHLATSRCWFRPGMEEGKVRAGELVGRGRQESIINCSRLSL